MNKKILKAFQQHYSDVLFQAANNDSELESNLKALLIEKVEFLESDTSFYLNPKSIDFQSFEKISKKHSIDGLVRSCISEQKASEKLSFNSFPRLNLPLSFVKHSVESLQSNPHIPVLIKCLITQIKLPLIKLLLTKPEYLEDPENSSVKLIESILNYIPIWKDESGVGFPTYTKLHQILTLNNSHITDLNLLFEKALQPIEQIGINQAKRSTIFEKRLVETQMSKWIRERAELTLNKLIKDVIERYKLPGFIVDLFNSEWKRLLTLDYVRGDHTLFSEHLKTMMALVLSVKAEISPSRLEWLIGYLPELENGIHNGFARLADEQLDLEKFLAKLEAVHIEIIANNNQSETTDESVQKDSTVNKGSGSQEEILRLKPEQLLFSGSDISLESASDENIESNNNGSLTEDSITLDTVDEKEDILISMSDNILKHTSEFSFSIDDIDVFYSDNPSSEVNEENISIIDKYQLSIGDWFIEETDNPKAPRLVKLILIDQQSNRFLFCNQQSQVVYDINSEQLLEFLKSDKLNKYQAPEFIEQGLISCVKIIKTFLTERRILKEEQVKSEKERRIEPVNIQEIQPNVSKVDKEVKSKERKKSESNKIDVKFQQSNVETIEQSTSIDIANLSVGSWLVFMDSGTPIKCKMAAKIASKSSLVFVDRSGKKVRDIKIKDLEALYQSGDIELKSIEQATEKILESVISKTRNLKSDR